MILVNTGDGKGKTTSALGLVMRALGGGFKVCVIQYLKAPNFKTGEREFLLKNDVEIHTMGIGFSWQKSESEQLSAVEKAWTLTKERLADPSYDLIVLDEINNIFATNDFDWQRVMPQDEVQSLLRSHDKSRNVVLTGRGAPDWLVESADLVTEMRCVKHYYDNGAAAAKGLEF
jgi:cob(I)alamin adenosyltransferase